MKKYVIIAAFIILLVIILVLWIIALRFPGLFMNLKRNNCCWIKESLGANCLTADDLNRAKTYILDINEETRNSVLSTIGTASYMDGGENYIQKSLSTNNLLWNKFDFLYDKLIPHLEGRLHCKCEYAMNYGPIALPGFHIFRGDSWLGKGWAIASLHIDMQEYNISWPSNYQFDWTKTYSFTIPISVSDDSGLYIFEHQANDLNYWLPLSITLRNTKRQKVNYKNGKCYLHHGKWFHMISPFNGTSKTGELMPRITLQGHGLYCTTTNSYWIYW